MVVKCASNFLKNYQSNVTKNMTNEESKVYEDKLINDLKYWDYERDHGCIAVSLDEYEIAAGELNSIARRVYNTMFGNDDHYVDKKLSDQLQQAYFGYNNPDSINRKGVKKRINYLMKYQIKNNSAKLIGHSGIDLKTYAKNAGKAMCGLAHSFDALTTQQAIDRSWSTFEHIDDKVCWLVDTSAGNYKVMTDAEFQKKLIAEAMTKGSAKGYKGVELIQYINHYVDDQKDATIHYNVD